MTGRMKEAQTLLSATGGPGSGQEDAAETRQFDAAHGHGR
jgi:hypothetical protein